MNLEFPNLFSRIDFGRLTAESRLWLAPLTVAYAHPDGSVSHAQIEHYARRARGGASVVMTEHFSVSESGRQLPRQTVVDDPGKVPGLRALADAIHEEGSLAIAQLGHAGRYAGPWDEYEKAPRFAPSAIEFPLVGGRRVVPAEMTASDIGRALGDFQQAAGLLADAGFDGIIVHASQGFLPSQFLSPRTNHRTDEYGGDFDRRIRFVVEALERVRAGFGARGAIGVQLLSDEATHGGWTTYEAVELSIRLQTAGAEFLLPTITTFETVRDLTLGGEARRWGHQLATAIAIQSAVDIPVIANGGLADASRMERLIVDGYVAGVAVGRPILSNADWGLAARAGSAIPPSCDCDPPTCLRTQLTGAVCHAWSATHQELGYWGREEKEA